MDTDQRRIERKSAFMIDDILRKRQHGVGSTRARRPPTPEANIERTRSDSYKNGDDRRSQSAQRGENTKNANRNENDDILETIRSIKATVWQPLRENVKQTEYEESDDGSSSVKYTNESVPFRAQHVGGRSANIDEEPFPVGHHHTAANGNDAVVFESPAEAAGALYQLCHLHLARCKQQQQQQRRQQLCLDRYGHATSPSSLTTALSPSGSTSHTVGGEYQHHHRRQDQWTTALQKTLLQAGIPASLPEVPPRFDRHIVPCFSMAHRHQTVSLPFPLFNLTCAPPVGSVLLTETDHPGPLSLVDAAAAAAAAVGCTGGVGGGAEFLRMKCRRNRTVFSEFHLTSLEKNFDRQKYLSTKDRAQLATRLGLSQIQVKTWYQNRRMKWKKQVLQQGGTQPPTKPKGRPRKQEECCVDENQLRSKPEHS